MKDATTKQSAGWHSATQHGTEIDLDYEIRALSYRNQRAVRHMFELCARISGQRGMLKKLHAERAAQMG